MSEQPIVWQRVEVNAPISAALIAGVLLSARFNHVNEEELQQGVHAALERAGLPVTREVCLTRRDRVDFLVNRVAVELKVAGAVATVARQLQRYARSCLVDELLLVTTCARHLGLPSTIGGKPLAVYFLGGTL